MRVSPINSYGYTVPNLRKTVNCKPSAETTGSIAFKGWRNAVGEGGAGLLLGSVLGGPVLGLVAGAVAGFCGAFKDDPQPPRDVHGNPESVYPYAADDALGVIHFD